MSNVNFSTQWTTLKEYLESASCTNLAALSTRPQVFRGQPERFEEQMPFIVVDILGAQQNRDRASANNLHQTFGTGFRLFVANRGSSQDDADTNVLAIVSAIFNDLAGSGSYLGTDRSTVFAAVVDAWSWDASNDDDLVSMALVDITLTIYRN